MRRWYDPTFSYKLEFPAAVFLLEVGSTQPPQSATPLQIVRSPKVSICSFANCSLPKLAELHPVDPFGNRDFGMLVISGFATEKPCSVFPLHGIARAPSDLHLTRNRLYCSVALACLPPLAPR